MKGEPSSIIRLCISENPSYDGGFLAIIYFSYIFWNRACEMSVSVAGQALFANVYIYGHFPADATMFIFIHSSGA